MGIFSKLLTKKITLQFNPLWVFVIFCLISIYSVLGVAAYKFYKLITQGGASTSVPTALGLSETKLWNLVNNWETEKGYEPYESYEPLCKFTEYVVSNQSLWTDENINTLKPDFPYSNFSINTATDYEYEEAVLDGWLKNPTTLKSLTDYFKYSCVKCKNNNCVQTFVNLPSTQPSNVVSSEADPFIDCVSAEDQCKGQSAKMRKSECSSGLYTCCIYANGQGEYILKSLCGGRGGSGSSNNRIPVTMPHNGMLFYCDADKVDEIKSASSLIVSSNSSYKSCLDQVEQGTDSCVNSCRGSTDSLNCIDHCYDDPVTGATARNKSCYDSASPYSSSWRYLIDHYCN